MVLVSLIWLLTWFGVGLVSFGFPWNKTLAQLSDPVPSSDSDAGTSFMSDRDQATR